MYLDNYNKMGDSASVAEELLLEIPELELKCKAVEKSVREGYFTLEEALKNYNVSEIEYIPYLLLKKNQKLKNANKQEQVFDTIYAIVSIFSSSTNSFDGNAKKAFSEIMRISEKTSSNTNVLLK